MRKPNLLIAAALMATLPVVPAVAAAVNPAQSLSVAKSVRAQSPTKKANALGGKGLIVGIVAAAAVIGGVVLLAGNDNKPDSN